VSALPWVDSWRAWRLDRAEFKDSWDSGIGAYRIGGRWNSQGRNVVYASADPATAIMEVAVHIGFDKLDTIPHVLTCFEVLDHSLVKVVQPEDVPNPVWLTSASPSPNQRRFADKLLAIHPFVLIPSSVTRHSWNLLISNELAEGKYQLISQARFGLDTRLVKP
jgi:RES domain-containing protein